MSPTQIPLRAAIALDERAEPARRHLRTALTWESCDSLELPPEQLTLRLEELSTCAALVYDLSPGTNVAISNIRECWLRFPDLPILLYVPAEPHVGATLTAIRDVPAVIEIQADTPAEPRRLQLVIRELFSRAANAGFRQMLSGLVGRMPSSVKHLVEQRIQSLETQPGSLPSLPSMTSLASRVGVTLRRLEQVSRSANLPAPKDLLDHVTLLWLTFGARRRRVSTAAFAREVGVSTERLYRLRRRLIRPRFKTQIHDPSTELITIFQSLVRSCHISLEATREWLGGTRMPVWEPRGNLAAESRSVRSRSTTPTQARTIQFPTN